MSIFIFLGLISAPSGIPLLEEWTTGVKKKNLTQGEKRVIEAEGRAEAEYDAWKESDDFVDE